MRGTSRVDAASDLEKPLHCLELRDRLGELAGEELVKQLIDGDGRILEAPALIAHCGTYSTGVDVEQVTDELIGMLCLDPIRSERVFRKVLEVVGDDDTRLTPDSSRKDVPVVGVRQFQSLDQAFV